MRSLYQSSCERGVPPCAQKEKGHSDAALRLLRPFFLWLGERLRLGSVPEVGICQSLRFLRSQVQRCDLCRCKDVLPACLAINHESRKARRQRTLDCLPMKGRRIHPRADILHHWFPVLKASKERTAFRDRVGYDF